MALQQPPSESDFSNATVWKQWLHDVWKNIQSNASSGAITGERATVTLSLSTTQQSTSHTLTGVPDVVHTLMVCGTADGGFSVGDVFDAGLLLDNDDVATAAYDGVIVHADASTVYARYNVTGNLRAIHPTTGAAQTITPGSWSLSITLMKF